MAARKKTTKKKTRRRVNVKEDTYTVKKGREESTAPDPDEEDIQAGSSAEALEKSLKGDPRAGQHDAITVTREKGVGGVKTEPATVSKVKPRTGFESFQYPYAIGVPMGFKALVEALPKRLQSHLVLGARYGKLHIQVPDANILEHFVREVEKKARGKTDVKHMAGTVANGIMESVKK